MGESLWFWLVVVPFYGLIGAFLWAMILSIVGAVLMGIYASITGR